LLHLDECQELIALLLQFQQSVLLAQKVVTSQREAIALEQKLSQVTSERTRLQQEVVELKTRLASFHQPQSYLVRWFLRGSSTEVGPDE
jgi:uncharacterized protein YlxW (UPF0749 family)